MGNRNCIDKATVGYPEQSLPGRLPTRPSGDTSDASVRAGLPSAFPRRSSTSLPAGLEGLSALRIGTAGTSATQAQADAQSTPTGFEALPDGLDTRIMQHLDGTSLDSALSVSRNFKTWTQLARQKQVKELAQRTGRFSREITPTRLELVGMGIPRPNIRNILNTLQATPIGAVIVPGQLMAHMQAHAELQQQVQVGNLVPRIGANTTDIGQVNDQGQTHGFGMRTHQNLPGQWYEGAFENGEPHGLGYEVFGNDDRYEGMFDNGRAHGHGTLIFANGARFEGMFENSRPHGRGTLIFADGSRHEGMYENGQRHGHGTLISADGGRYEGIFENDQWHGQGTLIFANGGRYEGMFENGQPHGQGTFIFADGGRYEGMFANGQRHGQGTSSFADGGRYEGMYENGQRHGRGTLIYANGDRYEGMFKNGKLHGQGTLIFANGDRYEGMYKNGKLHGQGTFNLANGDRYEGMYKNGQRHGQGTLIFANGDRYEGMYKNGQRHAQGTFSLMAIVRRACLKMGSGTVTTR